MRLNRKSTLGLGLVLTLASAGLVSAQALPPASAGLGTADGIRASSATWARESAALKPSVGLTEESDSSLPDQLLRRAVLYAPASDRIWTARKNCDAALAACMNAGGNSDACWNAYWRCTSN